MADPSGNDADDIAMKLGGGPEIPEGYVSFKGYLGPVLHGAAGDVQRLYMTDSFWSWLELRKDDIKDRLDVPPNQQDSRSIVWVSRDAKVIKCQAGLAYALEDEVWGIDPAGGPVRPGRPPY